MVDNYGGIKKEDTMKRGDIKISFFPTSITFPQCNQEGSSAYYFSLLYSSSIKLTQSAMVSTRVALSFATRFLVLKFGMMLVASLPAAVETLFYFQGYKRSGSTL